MACHNYSVNASSGNSGAGPPLQIPYGNKDAALRLGARYRAGGWYEPAAHVGPCCLRRTWLAMEPGAAVELCGSRRQLGAACVANGRLQLQRAAPQDIDTNFWYLRGRRALRSNSAYGSRARRACCVVEQDGKVALEFVIDTRGRRRHQRTKSAEGWRSFLTAHPDRPHAQSARAEPDKLGPAEKPPAPAAAPKPPNSG